MGSSASTSAGVSQNPRVQYTRKLEKKEHKKVLVDAPVLVDVDHGSVRYRQASDQISSPISRSKERPFETEDDNKHLDSKDHYFYHARLKDYGPNSSKENEDPFKFYYVLKGPKSAQLKKLYYVYGKGWDAKDGLKMKPTESVGLGKDYAWSSTRQTNNLYYVLEFTDDENIASTEEERLLSDLQSSPNKSSLRYSMTQEDRVRDLKARMAVRLLKSPRDIHIAYESKELRDEDVVGDLRQQKGDNPSHSADTDATTSEAFGIVLSLV